MSAASKGKPKSKSHAANISKSLAGKPKPWNRGEGNPNYKNKAQSQPEARANFLAAVKLRGQSWTDQERKRHSQRMSTSTNKMRGQKHTPEALRRISAVKKKQYAEGTVNIRHFKLSRAEKDITNYLRQCGHNVKTQFHITGVPYLYDLFLPDLNLLIEYQGNYWHANPRKYPPGTLLNIQRKGPTPVEVIWKRDQDKKEQAEQRGYRVVYVWEDDFQTNGYQAVLQCLSRS